MARAYHSPPRFATSPSSAAQAGMTVAELVARFAERDVITRQNARIALEEIGPPSVEALLAALETPVFRVRWEAAKALSTIADPRAAPALVRRLRDRAVGIRWLAAEGLIAIGRLSLRPLLESLISHSDSIEMREGAHHVLHDLLPGKEFMHIVPVLEALEHPAPELEVPIAAQAVLDQMDAGKI